MTRAAQLIAHRSRLLTLLVVALLAMGGGLVAQTALGQLGLTEAAARTFVLDEIKSPSQSRRSAVAITGTRAFLKLPAAARAGAATGLFAWA